MTDRYQKAIARRDQLRAFVKRTQKKIDKVLPELAELETYCRVHEQLGGDEENALSNPPLLPVEPTNKPRLVITPRQPQEGKKLTLIYGPKSQRMRDYARQLISKHGALTARGVLTKLDEIGMGQELIPGTEIGKRLSYLSSVLARDKNLLQDREAGGYIINTETKDLL